MDIQWRWTVFEDLNRTVQIHDIKKKVYTKESVVISVFY